MEFLLDFGTANERGRRTRMILGWEVGEEVDE